MVTGRGNNGVVVMNLVLGSASSAAVRRVLSVILWMMSWKHRLTMCAKHRMRDIVASNSIPHLAKCMESALSTVRLFLELSRVQCPDYNQHRIIA